jgi:hypothetical protein
MILDPALLHSSPQGKTHENIRKSSPGVDLEVLLSRTREDAGKYRGNNAIEAVDSDQWLVVGEPERFYLVTDH